MEQLDLISRDKLISALKFTMETANDLEPAEAGYTDGEFRIEVSYQHSEPRVIISVPVSGETKRKIDHSLSLLATQYIKEQAKVMQLQSRLRNMAGKFG